MLTTKDKAFLKSVNWKYKDIEMFEYELKRNEVQEPYYIRTPRGTPLAEVLMVGKKQCLKIY